MAFPGAVQDVAMRLPAAAARLAGVPGSGGPLEPAEAEQVAEMLATSLYEGDRGEGEGEADSTADALLSDESLRVAMLHLVAFAVRCPRSAPPAYLEVANRAAFICGSLLSGLEAPSYRRAKVLVAFARKLLRMDVLKCCSCQCSSEATRLATLSGAGDAAAGEAGAAAAAADGAVTYPELAHHLLHLATRTAVAARRGCAKWQQHYAGELAAALRDSHVLEHTARWALHVQLAESAGQLPQGAAIHPLTVVTCSHAEALRMLSARRGTAPARALFEALSGPCLCHALLSLGLAALCAADGGPSYGLPPELLLCLPLLGPTSVPITRGAPGKLRLAWNIIINILTMTEHSGWRPHVALLHRIGRFAVTSARAWAAEGAAAEGAGLTQLLLEEAGIMPAALIVLARLHTRSGAEQAAPAADPAPLAEAEAARWRLAVDVATHCSRWADTDDLATLAYSLEITWRPPTPQGLLAPVAPPAVDAALAGGLLPLWERLLRCTVHNPNCRERSSKSMLLFHMLERPHCLEPLWLLLAYGDPRQGAALVVTWGKLLRTLVLPQLLWSLGLAGAPGFDGSIGTEQACALADGAMQLLGALDHQLHVAGLADPDGSNAAAPQLQLARLASLAACEWLPSLARLACCEGMLEARYGVSETAAPHVVSVCRWSLAAILGWLPVLSRLCHFRPETAAAAAGVPGPAPTAAAGWRQLLLEDVGAVELLAINCRRVLPLAAARRIVPDFSRPLLEGCCLLAAACPGEVWQAVLAAAATAAAEPPEGGGGRGGFGGSAAQGRRQRPGLSGRGGEAGPSRAVVPDAPPGWSPQLFRAIEAKLRGCPGRGGEAVGSAAGALARQAEQWVAGVDEDAAELALLVRAWLETDPKASALRASSPADARALLRTCFNPACNNLAGDSEAELQLRACGRCGAAWYCRTECLAFHWRSGHKEACVGRRAVAAAEAGPGQSAA